MAVCRSGTKLQVRFNRLDAAHSPGLTIAAGCPLRLSRVSVAVSHAMRPRSLQSSTSQVQAD